MVPIFRNYKTDKYLTDLFYYFSAAKKFEIEQNSTYYLTIKTEYGRLDIWNSNFMYAWACQGTYTNSKGEQVTWRDQMASRWANETLYERIEEAQKQKIIPIDII